MRECVEETRECVVLAEKRNKVSSGVRVLGRS